MHQNVIVIDDFYSNPDEVREFALNVPYPEPEGGNTLTLEKILMGVGILMKSIRNLRMLQRKN